MSDDSVRETNNQGASGGPSGAQSGPSAPSFKLRFAAEREPGRSNVSAVRPLSLPAPLTDKWYARRGSTDESGGPDGPQGALRSVRERFSKGPRDTYPHPVTSAHEYGWWCGTEGEGATSAYVRTRHHIRDSAWLRARLRLLAPDAAYKRK